LDLNGFHKFAKEKQEFANLNFPPFLNYLLAGCACCAISAAKAIASSGDF